MGRRKRRMKNFKLQTPSSREAPSGKLQITGSAAGFGIWRLLFLWSLVFGIWSFVSTPTLALASDDLTLNWTNNLLTLSSPTLPGGKLDIWYLEAFCREGSTGRDWGKTVLPHKTQLVSADPRHLHFRTTVEPDVEMLHDILAGTDEIEIHFELKNNG